LSGAGYRVVGHSLMTKHEDLTTRVTFRLQTRSAANPMSVVDRLSNLEGVTEVEWE
jgi:uncharacterized membrane protein YhiD involved in acid resistance